jgi:hypothetical protein
LYKFGKKSLSAQRGFRFLLKYRQTSFYRTNSWHQNFQKMLPC